MGLELVKPGRFQPHEPLREMECCINRGGELRANVGDLQRVRIAEHCEILSDAGTLRIALRQARDSTSEWTFRVRPIPNGKGRPTGRARVNIRPALKACNLTAEAVAGRFAFREHEGLLLINLAGDQASEQKGKGK
jgi:hypothetical protein